MISFLVILELFLTENINNKEGELDYMRIKKVCNMNFATVNKHEKMYNYMIKDQNKIYDDILPPGFDLDDYQNRIKQKHLNEVHAKIVFLKRSLINNLYDLKWKLLHTEKLDYVD